MDIRIQCVVVDAGDCERLARFWSQALGWRITLQSANEWVIEPPEGSPEVDVAPDILFVSVPDRKTVKNRLHFDLRPADQQAQVRRLTELGAGRVRRRIAVLAPFRRTSESYWAAPQARRDARKACSRVHPWPRA